MVKTVVPTDGLRDSTFSAHCLSISSPPARAKTIATPLFIIKLGLVKWATTSVVSFVISPFTIAISLLSPTCIHKTMFSSSLRFVIEADGKSFFLVVDLIDFEFRFFFLFLRTAVTGAWATSPMLSHSDCFFKAFVNASIDLTSWE